MSTATIHRWGNGHGVLIPKQYLEKLGLSRGDRVKVSLQGDAVELRPIKSNRIEHLLADYTGTKPSAYHWGAPAGKELW